MTTTSESSYREELRELQTDWNAVCRRYNLPRLDLSTDFVHWLAVIDQFISDDLETKMKESPVDFIILQGVIAPFVKRGRKFWSDWQQSIPQNTDSTREYTLVVYTAD